ncbi:MAG TPA: methyl-accepting chemotaxis protein [Myxococcota bacterium]
MGEFEPTFLGAAWAKTALVVVAGGVAWGVARALTGDGDIAGVVGVVAAGVAAGALFTVASEEAQFLARVLEAMRLDEKERAPNMPNLFGSIARHINALADRGQRHEAIELPSTRPSTRNESPMTITMSPTDIQAVNELHEQARAQGQSLDDTSAAMAEMAATVRTIASSVESLASSAEESGSSILEMSAINDEMSENIGELAAAIEQTSASIEEMIYSIKEVAKNIEDLALAAEQTSTSMNQMEASINHVEENATATAQLSEDVIRDAARGADAVKRTIVGIEEIRASSRAASDVIRALGDRIGAIGNILNVIDDVAEQTNLLALNAAIIAAQAGEQGRGFAVVADEIKDLAERTGASTKEIADVIRSVQSESKNAIAAIMRAEKGVESGVVLSEAAEGALAEIVGSAGKATEMVKAIAMATVEQSKGSKVIADAVDRIARTVQQVAAATAEQARGSEQIMRSTERMKTLSNHVELSSEEQSKGSKQIATAIEHINEMVRQLHQAQQEQSRGSLQLLSAVEQLRQSQFKQIKVLDEMRP